MEEVIFEQARARLANEDVIAYIESKEFEAPKHVAWFEDQFEQSLEEKENKTLPFDFPALLFQFTPTKYTKGNGLTQMAEGEFVIHVGQQKQVDGFSDAASIDDHKKLLEYAGLIADLFHGFQLECSAKGCLTGMERDHLNRSLMVDKITFSWSGKRKKRDDVPE
jgi:hypothetical protein